MAEIVLDQLTKQFADGTAAVHEASFTIGDGEFFILVGPSGCGKSTLLNMIVGLEDITEGPGAHVEDHRIVIDGDDAGEAADVEDDATVDRHAGAADPAASGGGRDRDLFLGADSQDGLDLLDGAGTGHGGPERRDFAVPRPDHR